MIVVENGKTIAMASDVNYLEQLETAIKSIFYHNRNTKIYIINSDIPKEWFNHIRRNLYLTNDSIVDKKIDESIFKDLAAPYSYLSYMTYARLLIPQLIPENKVLYLDSDVIVNDKLDSLFNILLKDYYVAATPDPLRGFNAGVMLINNQLFHHNPHKVKQLFNISHNKENTQADQTALNIMFGGTYLKLSDQYNYIISAEQHLTYNDKDLREKYLARLDNVVNPKIIHYAGEDKPWSLASGGLMRDIWWQYKNLSWENVLSRRPLEPVRPKSKGEFFTFTPTDDLLNIKPLIKQLPEYTFNIAAGSHVLKTNIIT